MPYTFSEKNLYHWTAVTAAVVLVSGFLSLGAGAGIITELPVSADIPGGFILLIIGALLITGLVEAKADSGQWVPFGYTGLLLLLIFGCCTLLISGADALTRIIDGEFADLTSLSGSGFIWGAILALPAYPGIRRLLSGCTNPGDTDE
jgi:hypothetical protein